MLEPLITVKDLSVSFENKNVVDNISFDIHSDKITCIVGQSGSGKSMTALSIINMIPSKGKVQGEVIYKNSNLLNFTNKEMKNIRGKKIFSIFQNPMNSFNPSIKIKKQFHEFAKSYGIDNLNDFDNDMKCILESLNFGNPNVIMQQYPFQLSGGMLQRLTIALAMLVKPDIIIADEPTTALDVTVQKEILKQFINIKDKYGIAVLMITHDFGVVAEIADEVLVMNKGRIVEKGSVFEIFDNPQNFYTKSLLKATFEREVS